MRSIAWVWRDGCRQEYKLNELSQVPDMQAFWGMNSIIYYKQIISLQHLYKIKYIFP